MYKKMMLISSLLVGCAIYGADDKNPYKMQLLGYVGQLQKQYKVEDGPFIEEAKNTIKKSQVNNQIECDTMKRNLMSLVVQKPAVAAMNNEDLVRISFKNDLLRAITNSANAIFRNKIHNDGYSFLYLSLTSLSGIYKDASVVYAESDSVKAKMKQFQQLDIIEDSVPGLAQELADLFQEEFWRTKEAIRGSGGGGKG